MVIVYYMYTVLSLCCSWYSVLPRLDAVISCRIKKAVVGVTEPNESICRSVLSLDFVAHVWIYSLGLVGLVFLIFFIIHAK